MNIKAENLGYWYLRLNGFLTTTNFIVHPDQGKNQETDVDILGVRFPYRSENLLQPMQDDKFPYPNEKTLIIFSEIKSGLCCLNGPWTKPERGNMLRVIMAVGAIPKHEAEFASQSLYEKGYFENQLYYITLMCLGKQKNPEITKRYPKVEQITWSRVFSFIHKRFQNYRAQKISHGQWDENGKNLWKVATKFNDFKKFVENVVII